MAICVTVQDTSRLAIRSRRWNIYAVNASGTCIIIIIYFWNQRNDNILYINNYLCDSKHKLTVRNFIFFFKDNLCTYIEELCLQYFNNRMCNFLQMFIDLKRRDYKMALLFMVWFFGTMQYRYNFLKQLYLVYDDLLLKEVFIYNIMYV